MCEGGMRDPGATSCFLASLGLPEKMEFACCMWPSNPVGTSLLDLNWFHTCVVIVALDYVCVWVCGFLNGFHI